MNLRNRLRIFSLIIILLPIITLSCLISYVYKNQVQQNEEKYLNVAMMHLDELTTNRMSRAREIGKAIFTTPSMGDDILSKNKIILSENIAKYKELEPFLDYIVILDKNQEVIVKNKIGDRYKKDSILGKAVNKVMQTGEIWSSFELLPLEDLYRPASPSYEARLIPLQHKDGEDKKYLRKVLVGLNVIPIYKGENIVGAVVAADIFNKDRIIANSFSNRINDAYLILAVDDVWIATNIKNEYNASHIGNNNHIKVDNFVGRVGEDIGKESVYINGEKAIFMKKYIYNSDCKPIAKVGVGVSASRFNMIVLESLKYIVVLAIVMIAFMSYLSTKFANSVSKPILKMVENISCYGEIGLVKEDVRFNGDELKLLRWSFDNLVQKLNKKESERKQYLKEVLHNKSKIKELNKELKHNNDYLEEAVANRTKDLELVIEELKQSDDAKSGFLAKISHELRTPLNVINGSAEMLEEGIWGELNDKQRKYVANITQSGEHLLQLINDILDVSKAASGKMSLNISEFYLYDIIERAVSDISVVANEKQITVETNFLVENFKVCLDSKKLLQIMYNLLSNAVKFTPVGGKVTIIVDKEKERFEIKVKDTGIGIAEAEYDRVFLEFEQLENIYTREHTGTGLGLPIVKRLVELQGGNVQIKSEIGVGTEIFFVLPIDVKMYWNMKTTEEDV